MESLIARLPEKDPSPNEAWEFSDGNLLIVPNPIYPWASDEEEYDEALIRLGFAPDVLLGLRGSVSIIAASRPTAVTNRWPYSIGYEGDYDDVNIFCASFADFVHLFAAIVLKHRS